MRLYGFVMYNLSGIQKGIQFGHAALEYVRKFDLDKPTREFIDDHKTFIVLSGGGSNDMLTRVQELENLGINYAAFNEPDLNNSLSAVVFLVDAKIYDADDSSYAEGVITKEEEKLRQYLTQFRLA